MTATITALAQPNNVPPRVQLTTAGASGASAVIQRTDATGGQYPVRGGEPVTLVAGAAVLFDEEMPYGDGVYYQILTAGVVAATSATVTVNSTQAHLVHPFIPDLSIPLFQVVLGDEVRPSGTVLHVVPGRANPIPLGDGQRKSVQSQFTFRTRSSAETSAAEALFSGTASLLMQIVFPYTTESVWQYIDVGAVSRRRVTKRLGDLRFIYTVPFTVVDRPSGSVQSQWTYADVLATYSSYQNAKNKYASYTGVLTGVEGT